jgi:hypothetical protein
VKEKTKNTEKKITDYFTRQTGQSNILKNNRETPGVLYIEPDHTASMTKEDKERIQKGINAKFEEWLKKNGIRNPGSYPSVERAI